MNKTLINAALCIPVLLFCAMWAFIGLPETTIVSKPIFYYQYAMTFLTILLIPGLLWFVRRERFSSDKGYKRASILRLLLLVIMACVNIVSYFLIPNVAFFYLGVIIFLSLFFAIK